MSTQLIRMTGVMCGIIALPGQTIDNTGTIDYSDGYSLESDGTLYDPSNAIVASDVMSYDPKTTIVTYQGGGSETIAQINAGSGSDTGTGSGTSFLTGNTPLYIGMGLIALSFFIKD